jgi:3-hydroxyisobutyrate dehydrogenase-like beta-hydroxyacid dehydrogenase
VKIGFAGLGNMGARLASRLAGVGDLTVYDACEPSREAFRGRARVAGSIAEAGAGADVVGVCVRTGEQVRTCVDALLPVMPEGSMLMIHSTISPGLVLTLAQEGAARGVEVIDAPVTVTRYGVPDGPFVCTMIGAEESATERVRPLLDAYATEAVHVGRLGAGMSLKIINNLVSLVQITVAEEAFRLAALAGVPAEALIQVTTQNGALTPTMKVIAARAGAAPADRETGNAREVQARNGVKDLALAEALARSLDTPSAAATFAKGQYYHAYTANLPEARSASSQ